MIILNALYFLSRFPHNKCDHYAFRLSRNDFISYYFSLEVRSKVDGEYSYRVTYKWRGFEELKSALKYVMTTEKTEVEVLPVLAFLLFSPLKPTAKQLPTY